jgi:hypothetical protein
VNSLFLFEENAASNHLSDLHAGMVAYRSTPFRRRSDPARPLAELY